MMLTRARVSLAVSLLALSQLACAATEPLPPPPTEVLLFVRSAARELVVLQIGSFGSGVTIPLGSTAATPVGFAASNGVALVPLGDDDAVAVVDLAGATVTTTIGLPANSGATGAAMVDDSIGYVANPALNSVTQVNYRSGDTATVAVGTRPVALAFTRGRLFVLNTNTNAGGDPLGASWITVIDPVTNARSAGVDSIFLPGPGNARSVTIGGDGLLYIMNAGDSASGTARLSIVNPVTREELGNFGGFGDLPSALATVGERLLVTSWAEGLMEFDTRARTMLRGAGDAVAALHASGVAVGREGKVYTLDAGTCGAADGALTTRRSDLTVQGSFGAGTCPVGLVVTTIPVAP